MKGFKKYIFLILLIAVVAIQFKEVERSNPPVTKEIKAPDEVMSILRNSCYDCHSNKTKWPWYSYVAPVSWMISDHVVEGRKHLNFSEWGSYNSSKQKKLLEECVEEIIKEGMPLNNYTFLHPSSKMDFNKEQIIKKYALGVSLY